MKKKIRLTMRFYKFFEKNFPCDLSDCIWNYGYNGFLKYIINDIKNNKGKKVLEIIETIDNSEALKLASDIRKEVQR